MKERASEPGDSHGRFFTTQWTQVLAARGATPEAKQSLRLLCERYYAPVQMFVQRYTGDHQNAQDWTHAFFAKVLEGNSLDRLHESQGRFRSYLLGAVKHFLADERDKVVAAKRGGQFTQVPLEDLQDANINMAPNQLPPDAYFDRQWAISILDQALLELEAKAKLEGYTDRFELLRPWLTGDHSDESQTTIATQLNLSTDVVKVTLHRWRKQFRKIVRTHIETTVADASQVDEELKYLIEALAYR